MNEIDEEGIGNGIEKEAYLLGTWDWKWKWENLDPKKRNINKKERCNLRHRGTY